MDTTFITIECDRCHQIVEGMEFEGGPGRLGGTVGFYRTDNPEGWGKYADEGEHVLCDSCMQSDERYKKDYE